MTLFDFDNYKDFVKFKIREFPQRGHGQYSKIAKKLRIHTTKMTQIFRGSFHLTHENGVGISEYFELTPLETEYFINLIDLAKAGDKKTKLFFENRHKELKAKALNLSLRLDTKNTLSEEDQALYYSSWVYQALRLLSDIPKYQNISSLSKELGLSKDKLEPLINFLVERGLCEWVGEHLVYREKRTYLSQDAPMVSRHHTNWRLKSIEMAEKLKTSDLMYTNPVVMSQEDFFKVREAIVNFIEEFRKTLEPSPSEELFCLNIDWIQISNRNKI